MEKISDNMPLSNIRHLLEVITSASNKFQMISLNRQLEAAHTLLEENPPIDVAVLGQFKAGKSSFLNSLLSQNVLPVGVIPVTTAITRLQYGEKERVLVRQFDGRTTEVSLNNIAEYTSEAKNPGNDKNVAIVDIELPSMQKYSGLRLVDTPGLGSIYKYHQSTSEHWLPAVGTALLAVSSDRPLSEHDLDLIHELTTHTPNIILLLTKADILSPEQQKEVVSFFRQTLRKELHRDLPVYLYSTKSNTEEYKHIVEEKILKTISANRDSEFSRILHHKVRSLSNNCLNYLNIALNASLQADINKENLHSQILNEKVNEDVMREELGIICREHQRQTRPLIETYLEQFYLPIAKKVMGILQNEIPSWKGNLWKLSRHYETWVSETLSEEMRVISKSEHKHFLGTLKKAHAGLSRSLEAFCKFLGDNIENVLGVKMKEMDWKIDVTEPDHPDISFTKTFDIHLDLIWFLIPMFLLRKVFERHFISGVPKEVEINLSRLAYQWEKSINNSIEAMRMQAINYIHEELSTIEALLSRTQGQTDDIKQLHAQIEKLSGNL
ncbi:MAG: dynamin family protein [Syntrophaceae bacterium]|nr:dynamin family protein [Syntrophaceae bacterium]